MTMDKATLYLGRVFHSRHRPRYHGFRYRVFSILLDIDELATTAASCRLFSWNRFNLLSFHDRDHGPRDGGPLRPWVEANLSEHGLGHLAGGRIHILCFPRLWGFVFDPLSIYYVEDGAGRMAAIVYEVKNTFGAQHCYVLPVTDGAIRQQVDKDFHVSPFLAMELCYRFRLNRPDETLRVLIDVEDRQGRLLATGLTGRSRPFSDRTLIAAVARHPLMTLKVVAAIRWQALRLWLKGVPVHPRPEDRSTGVRPCP